MSVPHPINEKQRLDALAELEILDTHPEASFDHLTALAARLFQMPVALVALIDRDRQWFKSCYGAQWDQTSRDISFCAHTILNDGVMVISDTHLDSRFKHNPQVTGEPHIRFYAGAPLRTASGQNVGTICVIDTVPRQFSPDDQQTLKSLAAFVIDEMELKVSQRKLAASENRLRALLDGTSDIISVLDPDGTIRYQSASIQSVLGYHPEDLLGQSVYKFLHPEDSHRIEEYLRQETENPRQSGPIAFRFRHADGSWRTLESIARNCLNDPGVNGIVANSRDITQRQRDDERLRLLESVVVNTNDTVVITESYPIDEPGPRILYVNQAFTQMTGYTAAEAIGRSPRFMQGPETSREALNKLRKAMENGYPETTEVLNYCKDGSTFWAEMSIIPAFDDGDKHSHWISIQRDITESRRHRESLRAARDEAEKAREDAVNANLAKSEFLSRMSHELRTPLNAILGFGQLLEMSSLPHEDRQSVNQIMQGGRHLLALINEVLDIARIETGHLNLDLEAIKAQDACIEALAMVKTIAAEQNVRIRHLPPAKRWKIWADSRRLMQVLLNLLSNGVKYNRPGGELTVWCDPVADNYLRISVQDQGRGISPEMQKRLFTPFDRLDMDRGGVEGTGIGLALSERLTQAMNGHLGFQSEPGVGSTFWVEFPLAEDGELDSLETPSLDGAAPNHSQFKILYIEDNTLNTKLVKRLLERKPIEFHNATTGQEGLKMALQEKPGLILLDVNLPDMLGDEVLRQLLANPETRPIPVVILSADATPNRVQTLMDSGAKAYLTKPLDVQKFNNTIDLFLTQPTILTPLSTKTST